MSDRLAAVAYRIMIRATLGLATPGDGESIKNIVTTPLPNGAQCFVVENRSLYRLNKASTATPNGSSIIAPNIGGGRWFLVEDEDLAIVDPLLVFSSTNNVFPAVDTNWTAPSTSNYTNLANANFNSWTAGANGIWTYTGPSGLIWHLQWDVTFLADAAPGDITAGISRNADLAGAAGGAQEGAGVVSRTAAIVGRITVSRFQALTSGDVIQPRVRNSASASVSSSFSTISAVPVQG